VWTWSLDTPTLELDVRARRILGFFARMHDYVVHYIFGGRGK
jgi:hypothetical protein